MTDEIEPFLPDDEQHAYEVADLDRRFAFHPPSTDSRRIAHEQVRESARRFADDLHLLVPGCRERSLAWEAVEVAMYWANAGIARHYAERSSGWPNNRTAGELGLTGPPGAQQQVEPDPTGGAGTQNPASLVGTQDMPAPEGSDVPEQPAAPARNVTERAEAPHVPSVPPEFADRPDGGQPDPAIADPDTPSAP